MWAMMMDSHLFEIQLPLSIYYECNEDGQPPICNKATIVIHIPLYVYYVCNEDGQPPICNTATIVYIL